MSRSITLSFIVNFIVACMGAIVVPAYAATDVGLNVSPTHLAPVIPAGDTTRETIMLRNSSGEEMIVRGRIEGGTNTGSDNTGIHLDPEQITLKPGQTSNITLLIDVPAGSQSGQTRDVLLFDIISPSERELAIVGRVAVMLDIKTIHPVDEVDISIPHIIDSTESVSMKFHGRNTGNFPTMLRGTVAIDGLPGNEVFLSTNSDEIQIGQSAVTYAVWDDIPFIGAGTITATLGSGVGAPVKKTSWFVVFPWKLTMMFLLISFTGVIGAMQTPFLAKVFGLKWRKEGKLRQ
ncbi:MAG: hypothetical protein WC911_10140 [Thermoleophilia bacterium]